MIAARRVMAVALMVVVVACGSTPAPTAIPTTAPTLQPSISPSLSPTPSPSPTATPLPSAVTGSIPTEGGTLAVPGGAALVVPTGALKTPATARIAGAATTVAPTDAWPADSVGFSWKVDLGGAKVAKPVTLTLPFDPAMLPVGADPSELLLAYQDPTTGRWVPVSATVDPTAHTVSASVSHLSIWALFTINWDYWLGFIAKVASGNLTDLLGALGTLTTTCAEKSNGFVVDNSATNGMIKGCVQKVVKGTATIGVTNLRAISFALSGGALDASTGTILDAGHTVTFTAGGTKLAQPLVAAASLSPLALCYQLTDLTLRLLPGSDVFTKAGSYGKVLAAIATAEAKVWTSATILDKLKQNPPDIAGAAEEAFSLMTGHSFLGVFAAAAVAAGRTYGVPYLSALTPARFNKVMLAVNLLVLDTTVLTWDLQYFLAAYGEVDVTWNPWAQRASRCPFDTAIAGGPSGKERLIPSTMPKTLPVDLVPDGASILVTTFWSGWADPFYTIGAPGGSCAAFGGNYVEIDTRDATGQTVATVLLPGSAGPNLFTSCPYVAAARAAVIEFTGGSVGSDCDPAPGTRTVAVATGLSHFWVAVVLAQSASARAASGPALYTYDDVGGGGASTRVACGPKTSAKVCLAALAFELPQAYGGGRLDASQRLSIDAKLASMLGVAAP